MAFSTGKLKRWSIGAPPGKELIVLILTRRVNEQLRIGEEVTIKVISIKGHQIRFGIDAPPHIKVNREEVHKRILKEKEDAKKVTSIIKRRS